MRKIVLAVLICLAVFSAQSVVASKSRLLNPEVTASNGMVASAHPLASEVGVAILKQGGNAVDAAVATAFALSVVEPQASGIGGGGFMLVYMAESDETVFIDYREVAPKAASSKMFTVVDGRVVNDENKVGHKAIAIPGTVAGLSLALEKYGTLSLTEVLQPAIKYATEGFPVSEKLQETILNNYGKIVLFPETDKVFLNEGLPYETGDIFKNLDYAKTLQLIAGEGPAVFYTGEIAKALVKEVRDNGGIITQEDLAAYQPVLRQPVEGSYRGYDIISTAPPSAGGTQVIQILNMLESWDLRSMERNSAKLIHLLAEIFRRAYADRGEFIGDPDFVQVPLKGLLSKDYAKSRSREISLDTITEVMVGNPLGYESSSTTHLSVVDHDGNMVALTQTIECFFGSGVVVPGYGFLLNDQLHDMNVNPNHINSVQADKRPLSSMSPTLVLKDGKPVLSIGTPGGSRIITALSQILINMIDYQMSLQDAIEAPRVHIEEDVLYYEDRLSPEVILELTEMGYQLEVKKDYDLFFGGAQGVYCEDGLLNGGADPRRDGKAIGY